MFIRLVIKLFLLTSIACVSGELCQNGGIIELREQQTIKDTYSIGDSTFDCDYRCHPSDEANAVIEKTGVESMFTLEFCPYYETCQVS